MNTTKLAKILKSHKNWVNNTEGGERADLRGANLRWANLRGADLEGADLRGADYAYLQCPEKGAYIAYKIAGDFVVKLLVTENAKRSSATSRKCRCSEAKVISITNIDGTKAEITEISSNHDKLFIYRIGETVKVDNFDEDRWNECSTGIHHFITRQEAVNYKINRGKYEHPHSKKAALQTQDGSR